MALFREATPAVVLARLRLLQLEQWLRGRLFGLELEAVRGLYARTTIGAQPMAEAIVRAFASAGPDGRWQLTDAAAAARNDRLLGELDIGAQRILDSTEPFLRTQAERAYRAGYYGRAWVMANLTTPDSLRYGPVPQEAVAAAINAPYEGSSWFMRFGDARSDFIRRMRRAVATSQAQGDPIGKAMHRLSQELGWNLSPDFRFPVGHRRAVKLTGLTAQLERIARTEIIRTSNMGMEAVMRENRDVLRGFEWIATQDKRTCPICAPLDGRIFKLDSGQRRPPAHPLCRCSQAPAVLNPMLGPRETYADWAAKNSVRPDQDGGLAGTKPAKAPQAKAVVRGSQPKQPRDFVIEPGSSQMIDDEAQQFIARGENTKNGQVRASAKQSLTSQLTSRMSSTPEGSAMTAKQLERAVDERIKAWAQSSSSANSLSLQMNAAKEFGGGVTDHLITTYIGDTILAREAFDRQFLRQMYNHTQEELSARGIKFITLHRGAEVQVSGAATRQKVLLQPLSSFSSDLSMARQFAEKRNAPAVIYSMRVPVQRIISTARTGLGALPESEFVVLGAGDSWASVLKIR